MLGTGYSSSLGPPKVNMDKKRHYWRFVTTTFSSRKLPHYGIYYIVGRIDHDEPWEGYLECNSAQSRSMILAWIGDTLNTHCYGKGDLSRLEARSIIQRMPLRLEAGTFKKMTSVKKSKIFTDPREESSEYLGYTKVSSRGNPVTNLNDKIKDFNTIGVPFPIVDKDGNITNETRPVGNAVDNLVPKTRTHHFPVRTFPFSATGFILPGSGSKPPPRDTSTLDGDSIPLNVASYFTGPETTIVDLEKTYGNQQPTKKTTRKKKTRKTRTNNKRDK